MEILPLQPEYFEKWQQFRRLYYPSFPHYATDSFYAYRFQRCPPAQRPVHRVAVHNREIVGELYAVRVRVAANGIESDAWAPADLMVAEAFRKLGIWRYLMTEAVKPLSCSSFIALAAGPHTYDFYKIFGEYEPIAAGAWYHLPLNLRPYFLRQGKTPIVAGLLSTLSQPLVWKTQCKAYRQAHAPAGLTVRPCDLPPDFSNRQFLGNQMANVNDADWYRWRMQAVAGFKDQDQFLEATRDGQRVGFAVCGHVQRFIRAGLPSAWIGLIKECRTLPGHEPAMRSLLRACIQWLRQRPSLEGIRMFAPQAMSTDLAALGFNQREPHQAIVGGPLLVAAASARSGLCAHDDVEVRHG